MSGDSLVCPEVPIKNMTNLLSVDPKLKPWEQSPPLHNRWHPDIPPTASVEEDQVFRVECAAHLEPD